MPHSFERQAKPGKTVDELTVQFYALQRLLNSKEAENQRLKQSVQGLEKDNAQKHPSAEALNAERETNAQLTEALLASEERTAQANEELQLVLDDWNAIVKALGAKTNGTAIAHAKKVADFYKQHNQE